MYHTAHPLFLICETPLHAGCGDDLGIVDLPIQRERHTAYPKIEGSSLKGALREVFEQKLGLKNLKLLAAFGPESDDTKDSNTFAACLGFSDARILLFPVKSMKGVFAWVTCPHVLNRFNNDLEHANKGNKITNIPSLKEGEAVVNSKDSSVKVNGKHVLLEEYAYTLEEKEPIKVGNENFEKWLANTIYGQANSYWKTKMEQDLVILSDDDFKAFVEHSTEVVTRIKIDNNTGTAQDGALFTEEFLPSESIMYALVLASPEFKEEKKRENFPTAKDSIDFFETTLKENCKNVLQIGGDATIGKGIVRANLLK